MFQEADPVKVTKRKGEHFFYMDASSFVFISKKMIAFMIKFTVKVFCNQISIRLKISAHKSNIIVIKQIL